MTRIDRTPDPRLHRYVLPGGWVVLAGKADRDNEQLSLELARPDDFWFHVRGMSGSHVVLRAEEGRAPDRETIEQAAAIAAWHSKARSGGVVPVSCTLARYVTRAPGARTGTVQIRKEKVIKVRPAVPGESCGPSC